MRRHSVFDIQFYVANQTDLKTKIIYFISFQNMNQNNLINDRAEGDQAQGQGNDDPNVTQEQPPQGARAGQGAGSHVCVGLRVPRGIQLDRPTSPVATAVYSVLRSSCRPKCR